VGSEIVEDDDVARGQRRREELLDIGAKALAVDRSIEQAGRVAMALAAIGMRAMIGTSTTPVDDGAPEERLDVRRLPANMGNVVVRYAVHAPQSSLQRC
jgi:hypothetical protein